MLVAGATLVGCGKEAGEVDVVVENEPKIQKEDTMEIKKPKEIEQADTKVEMLEQELVELQEKLEEANKKLADEQSKAQAVKVEKEVEYVYIPKTEYVYLPKTEYVEVIKEVEVPVEVIKEVEKEVIKEVEVIVEVPVEKPSEDIGQDDKEIPQFPTDEDMNTPKPPLDKEPVDQEEPKEEIQKPQQPEVNEPEIETPDIPEAEIPENQEPVTPPAENEPEQPEQPEGDKVQPERPYEPEAGEGEEPEVIPPVEQPETPEQPEQPEVPETPENPQEPQIPAEVLEAIQQAKDYINITGVSRNALFQLLAQAHGYSSDTARYAIETVENEGFVDWHEEAKQAAQEYIDSRVGVSYRNLIEVLQTANQFTDRQAQAAVDAIKGNVNWRVQCLYAAQKYVDTGVTDKFTLNSILRQAEGFLQDEINWAFSQLSIYRK